VDTPHSTEHSGDRAVHEVDSKIVIHEIDVNSWVETIDQHVVTGDSIRYFDNSLKRPFQAFQWSNAGPSDTFPANTYDIWK
jgi:hypothetical protein